MRFITISKVKAFTDQFSTLIPGNGPERAALLVRPELQSDVGKLPARLTVLSVRHGIAIRNYLKLCVFGVN